VLPVSKEGVRLGEKVVSLENNTGGDPPGEGNIPGLDFQGHYPDYVVTEF
jgi:hypothetical protein